MLNKTKDYQRVLIALFISFAVVVLFLSFHVYAAEDPVLRGINVIQKRIDTWYVPLAALCIGIGAVALAFGRAGKQWGNSFIFAGCMIVAVGLNSRTIAEFVQNASSGGIETAFINIKALMYNGTIL